MTNYLVVTAMGDNGPGIVNKLANVANECECDIVDSRMAIFGNEFTMIMLLSGSWTAINTLEAALTTLTVELGLLTVMKRSSKHLTQLYESRLEAIFEGKDQRGTMQKITKIIASHSLDIAAVRSHAEENLETGQIQSVYFAINIPTNIDIEKVKQALTDVANELDLACRMKILQSLKNADLQ